MERRASLGIWISLATPPLNSFLTASKLPANGRSHSLARGPSKPLPGMQQVQIAPILRVACSEAGPSCSTKLHLHVYHKLATLQHFCTKHARAPWKTFLITFKSRTALFILNPIDAWGRRDGLPCVGPLQRVEMNDRRLRKTTTNEKREGSEQLGDLLRIMTALAGALRYQEEDPSSECFAHDPFGRCRGCQVWHCEDRDRLVSGKSFHSNIILARCCHCTSQRRLETKD